MNLLPTAIQKSIDALSDLNGIGYRSAERIVFSLLNNQQDLAHKIARSFDSMADNVAECEECHYWCEKSEQNICSICKAHRRTPNILCVVENPFDIIALEKTHEFQGYYHVLHGVVSPSQKVSIKDLRIESLMNRVKEGDYEEVIFALPGNTEGDATVFYIVRELKQFFKGEVSHLARGIPTGGSLDYLDMGTIGRALMDRRKIEG